MDKHFCKNCLYYHPNPFSPLDCRIPNKLDYVSGETKTEFYACTLKNINGTCKDFKPKESEANVKGLQVSKA